MGRVDGELSRVKRNLARFPDDFMFPLTLRSTRFEVTDCDLKNAGGTPLSAIRFTEQGVALSTVLRSDRAIQVNIEIMRTFVRLRRMLASHEELSEKLAAVERKYDRQFKVVFDAIRELMAPPDPKPRRRIGFAAEEQANPSEGGERT